VWQGDGKKQVLTITVPLLVAADPRQGGGKGTEHVVECPGDDYVVVQRAEERYGYHTNSQTYKQSVSCDMCQYTAYVM